MAPKCATIDGETNANPILRNVHLTPKHGESGEVGMEQPDWSMSIKVHLR
jgi:hypothetical protein